jgi:putative oxidoreductase
MSALGQKQTSRPPIAMSANDPKRTFGDLIKTSALLMFLYTLGTALIGHRCWTTTGADRVASMYSFYKNLSIMRGFLLLCITGAGKYSADVLFGIAAL